MKKSWSQQGEDVLIDFYFTWILGEKNPMYLDIGAHHPFYLSNTYLFYTKGCRGVTIEPDPLLFENIKKARPGDVHINAGIGKDKGCHEFFIMSAPTMNTFSIIEAETTVKNSDGAIYIKEKLMVEVLTINSILSAYFNNDKPYFISIDVEGLDLEILYSIDFDKHKPALIIVELNGRNETEVALFMSEKGYKLYASNNINYIFIKKIEN